MTVKKEPFTSTGDPKKYVAYLINSNQVSTFLDRLLTTGTIEEKIFQRQVLKQGLSGAVVDSRDSSRGHFTRDELKVGVTSSLPTFGLKTAVF